MKSKTDIGLNKKNIDKHLTEGEQDTIKSLGMGKLRKLIKKLTQQYNNLCPACQKKLFNNPKMKPDEYCDKCRGYIVPVVKKFTGDNDE